MQIELRTLNNVVIAQLKSDFLEIKNLDDALDLLGNAAYQGASHIFISEKNIVPDFFDLKTGIAGEILQKFSTYSMRLSIVGDFSKFTSKSLKDFIYESNKSRKINFVSSLKEAEERILKG